jgi:zinc protease
VPLPALALLWPGPPAIDADSPALQVADALLGAGVSSRLNDALVVRRQLAQAVGVSADLYAEAGMIVAYAIAADSGAARHLQGALLQQIRRLARAPISPVELDKVRIRLLTAALLDRQRPDGRCEAAGWALALHGDAGYANRELAALQAVGAGDVQRVLRKVLLDTPPVMLGYRQGPAR